MFNKGKEELLMKVIDETEIYKLKELIETFLVDRCTVMAIIRERMLKGRDLSCSQLEKLTELYELVCRKSDDVSEIDEKLKKYKRICEDYERSLEKISDYDAIKRNYENKSSEYDRYYKKYNEEYSKNSESSSKIRELENKVNSVELENKKTFKSKKVSEPQCCDNSDKFIDSGEEVQ